MQIPYFVPWINNNDKKAVLSSLSSRWLTNGPILKKFESKFSKFIHTKYAAGVGSATHALHLSTRAIGIGSNDEVIVPTFTFVATVNAVIYCGAKPVLVDVDPETFNISPKEIKKKITKKTKAIILVHYGGQASDMDEILELASRYRLKVVEDCAHALGSKYKNKKCGELGTTGCFSFYPTKIITSGEGGMITTNDKLLHRKIEILKSQGMNVLPPQRELKKQWKYDIIDLGYNYRLDEIRSSLGLSQLERVNQINKMRSKIAKKYDEKIKKIKGLVIPKTKLDRNHIYHLYTIKVDKEFHLTRNKLFLKLLKNGIGTSVQYLPVHKMTYYKNKFNSKDKFPVADKLKDQVLSLPIYPKMTSKQIEYVITNLR